MKKYLDVHKYEQYCKLCEDLEVKPLTFEEIYEQVDDDTIINHAKEIENRSEQLGNAGKSLIAGFNKIWTNPAVQNGVRQAGQTAIRNGQAFLSGMSWGQGANAVIDFAINNSDSFFSGGGNNNGGGQNNNSNYGSNSSPGHAMNSLQFKDNPMELKLDTGIQNRVWTDTILAGTDEFSPMHMTSVRISLERLLADGAVARYFSEAFYMKLVNYAQSRVNFSIATLSDFSEIRIRTYFSAIFDALNCYFYFVSIMNYFDNPQNNNYAMTDLRRRITPDMQNSLMILQRQLTTCPIPPKLMNFLYYLNGNFKANHLDGSAIIKMETASLTTADIDNNINKLKELERTASALSRVFPEWLFADLPTYPGTTFHDYNYNTIWTNLPFHVVINEKGHLGPFPYYDDGSIVYQTFTSELDGASIALVTIVTDDAWTPGLVTPKNSSLVKEETNRVTWDNNGWVNSSQDTNHSAARMDTYPACAIFTAALSDPEVKSMCEPVKSVNLNTVRQAAFDFIDFISSFDVKNQTDPSVKRNKRSRRK